MLDKAKKVTKEAHEGQERMFSGNPYFYHPFRVGKRLDRLEAEKNVVATGFLHDTVEDTSYELTNIEEQFNSKVASLVLELTNNGEVIESIGKTEYMKHNFVAMSDEALLVKLADREDNTSDLSNASDSFASRYSKETKTVLDHLEKIKNIYGKHRRLVNSIRNNIQNVD
jgi:GTP pyrophosphokinase